MIRTNLKHLTQRLNRYITSNLTQVDYFESYGIGELYFEVSYLPSDVINKTYTDTYGRVWAFSLTYEDNYMVTISDGME
jgi:hypothetical protein